jgi:hydrogenase maturation protease
MNVLVAGLGNVFRSDDGFGVEVIRRLGLRPLPPGVQLMDAGIRSLHLAYALLDRPALLLVIDAVTRGEPPGTLYVIEPALNALEGPVDAHDMDLQGLTAGVRALGGEMPPVLLVGCEPAQLDDGMGLSPAVEAAIDPAVEMVCKLAARGGMQ